MSQTDGDVLELARSALLEVGLGGNHGSEEGEADEEDEGE